MNVHFISASRLSAKCIALQADCKNANEVVSKHFLVIVPT